LERAESGTGILRLFRSTETEGDEILEVDVWKVEVRRRQLGYENIFVREEGWDRVHHFNRPKVLNALNRKTVEMRVRDALVDATGRRCGAVLIFTGAGGESFVAGADIGELAQRTDR